VGTIPVSELVKKNSSALSANLSRQEWQMLARFAQAVFELASMMVGKDGLNHVPFCRSSSPVGVTVSELLNEFLRAKAKSGRSDRYLRALRVSLKSFARGRGQVQIGNVTVGDVETWLEKSGWAIRTRRGYLSDVRVMFNFAVRRNMLAHNPATAVELPVLASKPPEIHTVDEVRIVLDFARTYNLNICRCLAIRYFGGLRSSEAEKLEETEIRKDYIEVTAAKSKTRRRRLVLIQPNLRAWLDLGGKLPLHDISSTWRFFTAALNKQKGIAWAHNVTRHSFVSYHLARFGNAGKTALEAGHSEQMLFAHYRELVAPEAAAAYWEVRPLKTSAET
jgi:integrase-like protein